MFRYHRIVCQFRWSTYFGLFIIYESGSSDLPIFFKSGNSLISNFRITFRACSMRSASASVNSTTKGLAAIIEPKQDVKCVLFLGIQAVAKMVIRTTQNKKLLTMQNLPIYSIGIDNAWIAYYSAKGT